MLVLALNISGRTPKTLISVVNSEGLHEEGGRIRKETYFLCTNPFCAYKYK